VAPVVEKSSPVRRELLFCCEHFGLSRISARPALSAGDEARAAGEGQFVVGAAATPRVLVCIAGEGRFEHAGTDYAVARGDVFLLPAVVGACCCRTSGAITLLDISLPEGNARK
jgi:mannose-6-phosphate isomerase